MLSPDLQSRLALLVRSCSRLTHLAEAGVQLPILMAKSRHTSLISLAVYAQPTFDAVAAATAALDPDRRH
jgi:hypothetical protein